jgi:hypothetical protein
MQRNITMYRLHEEVLRTFDNKMLRRIFGPERDEEQEVGVGCTLRSFVTCTLHQVQLQ